MTCKQGVDISQWNSGFDFDAAHADGYEFALIRASVRVSMDPDYIDNAQRARAAGMLTGSYHYIYPDSDPIEQAQAFVRALSAGQAYLDCWGAWLDVEENDLTWDQLVAFYGEFCKLWPHSPVGWRWEGYPDNVYLGIYTSISKWDAVSGKPEDERWNTLPLWTADWKEGATEPRLPQGWDSYMFWQYTSKGQVAGYSGNVDLNYSDYTVPAKPEPEVPMGTGTLLTIHAQSKGQFFDKFMREAKPWYVKLMDWGTDWPYPDTRVILRMFEDDDITSERASRGAAGAREAFDKWAGEWSKRAHYAWAFEDVANEPHPMYDTEFNKNLDEYTCEMSYLFKQEGWIYAGNLFSVGWPDIGMAYQFKNSMTELANNGHLWGPHEYNNPVMDVTGTDGRYYWTGRIANTIQELRQAGATVPSLYIGECGIDCGVSTPACEQPPGKGVVPQEGWLYLNQDPNWYFPQLVWYDDGLAQVNSNLTANVITACIYNSGGYSPWESFEITEPLMDMLIQRWQTYRGERPEIGGTAPPTTPPKPMPPEETVEPVPPPTEPEPEPEPEPPEEDPLAQAIEHLDLAWDYSEKSQTHIAEARAILAKMEAKE